MQHSGYGSISTNHSKQTNPPTASPPESPIITDFFVVAFIPLQTLAALHYTSSDSAEYAIQFLVFTFCEMHCDVVSFHKLHFAIFTMQTSIGFEPNHKGIQEKMKAAN